MEHLMDQADKKSLSNANFILLGKTGSGKSASGNTILGRKAFISKKCPTSVTQDIQIEHGMVGKDPVTVCDTPGFFSTDLSDEQIIKKCQRIFSKCESEFCVFLMVIKADRFTEEEKRTVEKVEKLLGENRLEKTWILFTRGDELEEENLTIEEFIKSTPDLKNLVKKYQDRYHVFNNKKKKFNSQVRSLLKKTCNKIDPLRSLQKKRKQTPESPCNLNSGLSERSLILLGKAGAGKSASGNTILGKKVFKSALGMKAVTGASEVKTEVVEGRTVSVVDTPGLCDTDMDPKRLMTELARAVSLSSPGAHAFLITLPLIGSRFTMQEQEVIQQIKMIFGEEVTKYTILLFTHGDCLEGKKIEDLIKESSVLRELVQECGGYHVINNKKHSNRKQVIELLNKIDTMVEKNRGTCYSNQMFTKAARLRQEEEERVRKEEEEKKQREEHQRQEEIERVRKETEERVRREILKEKKSNSEETSCSLL